MIPELTDRVMSIDRPRITVVISLETTSTLHRAPSERIA